VKLVVTIYEKTPEEAIAAIRGLSSDHDMIEVRLDPCGGGADFRALRAATIKPIIVTNRGGKPIDVDAALGAGIDFVDVELGNEIAQHDRTVLSHHDFEGIPRFEPLFEEMLECRCAHLKIAVTPRNLRENEMLIDTLRRHHHGLTLFGMGERGLYSRILAPFFGSELAFVSTDDAHSAAPGQLTLERALPIYGDRQLPTPHKIFAVAGNPAGHSLSPSIHNPLFRQHGLPAAYTIASFETFDEIADAFQEGRIAGLSITSPFKDDALAFAKRAGAGIGPNAREAAAVNTLVHTPDGVIADNTDVDGFELLLRGVKGKRAAVIGAGGTGRAALVALRRAGMNATVYNRTPKPDTQPLEKLAGSDAEVIINTLPAGVKVEIPPTETYIEAAYGGRRAAGGGRRLLEAQAIRQNELFRKAFE
jgi:3-dehydroquinate dehydratase type I